MAERALVSIGINSPPANLLKQGKEVVLTDERGDYADSGIVENIEYGDNTSSVRAVITDKGTSYSIAPGATAWATLNGMAVIIQP